MAQARMSSAGVSALGGSRIQSLSDPDNEACQSSRDFPSRPAAATGAQPSLFDQNSAMPWFKVSTRSTTSAMAIASIDFGAIFLTKLNDTAISPPSRAGPVGPSAYVDGELLRPKTGDLHDGAHPSEICLLEKAQVAERDLERSGCRHGVIMVCRVHRAADRAQLAWMRCVMRQQRFDQRAELAEVSVGVIAERSGGGARRAPVPHQHFLAKRSAASRMTLPPCLSMSG